MGSVTAIEHGADAATAGQRRFGFLLLPTLCAASSLSVLNALALSPFLARIAPDMHVSVATMGQAGTLSGLVGASLGLGLGTVADGLGYRRLLLAGSCALVAAALGTALAPTYLAFLVAQLLGGLAASTISPMAFAFAGTLYDGPERRRAITRIYSAAAGTQIVAFPLLTRLADSTSWRWPFAALGGASVVLVWLALAALPRDPRPPVRPGRLRELLAVYAPLAGSAATRLLYAAQFLRGVAWSGTLAYMGAYIDDALGYSVRAAGFALTATGGGFLAGSLLVGGRLRGRPPRPTFIAAVATMGALIAAAFLWRPGMGATFPLLFLVAVCGGIAEVTMLTIIAAETPAPQGPTMALHSSILRYGGATGALLGGGLLAVGDYAALGLGFPVIAALAAVACTLTRREPRRVAMLPDS